MPHLTFALFLKLRQLYPVLKYNKNGALGKRPSRMNIVTNTKIVFGIDFDTRILISSNLHKVAMMRHFCTYQ